MGYSTDLVSYSADFSGCVIFFFVACFYSYLVYGSCLVWQTQTFSWIVVQIVSS